MQDDSVSVHVLSEFAFCSRAGVLALETDRSDTGDETDRLPRLDYLPDYNLTAITNALQAAKKNLAQFLTFAPPVIVVLVLIGMFFDWLIAGALALSSLFLVWRFAELLWAIGVLKSRERAALAAIPRAPDPDSMKARAVNWWDMIKAGFVPIEPERAYEDPNLGLVGKPWRILQKGSLRIPVFRKRADSRQLHPQHLIRIVAYCHLLRKCEGADSPYGIVLQGREYEGIALPAKDSPEALKEAIKRVRQMQYAVEVEGLFPNAPDPLSRCRGCPWGKPRRHRNRKSETILSGQVVEPFLSRGSDKHLYHSTCGDRCYWVPPHERAEALSLSRG